MVFLAESSGAFRVHIVLKKAAGKRLDSDFRTMVRKRHMLLQLGGKALSGFFRTCGENAIATIDRGEYC